MRRSKRITDNNENYCIDFFRFVFSCLILIYHGWVFTGPYVPGYTAGYFKYGYYGVDFYFIVTGYLMMNSIAKQKIKSKNIYKETFEFVFRKFKKLFPGLLVTFIFGITLVYGMDFFDSKNFLSNNLVSEIMQLNIFGYNLLINKTWWYISAMLFVLFLLYPLARKNKDGYIYYFAPLIMLVALAIVKYTDIKIDYAHDNVFLFKNGFYKGLIFIILGNFAYQFALKMKNKDLNKLKTVFLTILESAIYILLICNTYFSFMGSIAVALLFVFVIALTFSKLTYSSKIFRHDIWRKLGIFGFYMYLCQISVRTYWLDWLSHQHQIYGYHRMLCYYVVMTVILSILIYIIVEVIYKRLKKYGKPKWLSFKRRRA